MTENSDNVKKQSTGRLDKSEGSYYTPRKTAAAILDIAGYKTDNSRILKSRIIDPSCGDGALLVEAAARFIEASLAEGLSPAKTARGIALKFHAYEIDAEELEKAKVNVAAEAAEHGIPLSADELENFRAGDAFKLYKNSLGPFEYVVGNPPYVRIHNLSEKPESSYIEGMCDLFYPFFDIGQKLLAEDGVLCYIAPSSWFTARAGRLMRKDLQERSAISAVCDFGHYQVFAPYATAYTAIVRIEALPSKKIKVFPANAEDGHLGVPHLVRQSAAWVNGMFLPKAPEHISEILEAADGVDQLHHSRAEGGLVAADGIIDCRADDLRRDHVGKGDARSHQHADDEIGLAAFQEVPDQCGLAHCLFLHGVFPP